ncbi:hypothetical protein Dacsa_2097 [Dactylococcopsis salina PCC 8305]|uniref:Uncharacterized protein n=1 Tax=Dactylococcopsis salina (strain PCC 8305) TaxID=13035 RepID=K9YV19_DACS8|nr:hypothetical protein Dacsa_2097 [Dactylococcopsis salina PCC 8305]
MKVSWKSNGVISHCCKAFCVGLKLQRESTDHNQRVKQWLTERGETIALQAPKKWGMATEIIPDFIRDLWQLLTEDLNLLANTKLRGKRSILRGCNDVYQLDGDFLLMVLDQQFSMLRSREHSAQVPAKDREKVENLFKNEHREEVNTLIG